MAQLQPVLFQNPFLSQVLQTMPAGNKAAYSQDIGALLFNFSGQPAPTFMYPNFPPGGFFLGGAIPGLVSFLPQQQMTPVANTGFLI